MQNNATILTGFFSISENGLIFSQNMLFTQTPNGIITVTFKRINI